RVLMLEYAIYSVISPEGCAAILWKDRAKAPEAASALRLTAPELLELGLIDDVVKEPLGGAHRDPAAAAEQIHAILAKYLKALEGLTRDELLQQRYEKYRKIGAFEGA
ncbi:MAG: acetyl-CoA carboxylase carboxyl transferase subunit alpha, partial [Candidatus Omnitrophica bacterium]|nr:acetyl-CoA carboxylase carboxyl transferase subunit alpha [Candidatus Omnitrophota bacterium]